MNLISGEKDFFFATERGTPFSFAPMLLRHGSLKTRKRKTILQYFTFIFYDAAYASVPIKPFNPDFTSTDSFMILLHFLDGGC